MKRCTCCKCSLTIGPTSNPRPVVYAVLYGIIFECPECASSQFHTLWREPDEDELLLAGELRETTNSLSDLRREEAA
jgi:hypothetical protein